MMNPKNNLTANRNDPKSKAQPHNTVLFANVNLHQLHLTPSDLKGYEDVYPGAAKDILQLIQKTIDSQHSADTLAQQTNQSLLKNEKQRIYLSFFLAVLALLVGCYLSVHPSTPAQVIGIILLLAVCLSAFNVKILSWTSKIFRK